MVVMVAGDVDDPLKKLFIPRHDKPHETVKYHSGLIRVSQGQLEDIPV